MCDAVELFVQWDLMVSLSTLSAMETSMKEQSQAVPYLAALDAASAEFNALFEEAKKLRNRIEQIDSAIHALKPLVPEANSSELNPTMEQVDSVLATVLA
jgi:hypothetical protein